MRRVILILLFLQSVPFSFCGSVASADDGASPFDFYNWNSGAFVFGADYYPEAWPRAQWEQDAAMMQKAGINFVRLAEFAWVKLEPSEGVFNFTWLDDAIVLLSRYNIRVLIGTPTASPPAWLIRQNSEIQEAQLDGLARYRYGSRANRILQAPAFVAATTRIVTAIAAHYANNTNIIGYQLDNEFGGPNDYSFTTQTAFQQWLRKKYDNLDTLNARWGTVFWGHTYSDWSQVPLPWNTLFSAYNPSLYLDFYRFNNNATIDYIQQQISIIRSYDSSSPKKAITTNLMGTFPYLNYFYLSTPLDFASWDNYPLQHDTTGNGDYNSAGLAHDLMRSIKNQNFMIMEQQAGIGGWNQYGSRQVPPQLYRLYAYQAIAHGADGVNFFRWRTSRFGTEQHWQGILDADSYPNGRYQQISKMGAEVQQIRNILRGTTTSARVAILLSYDSEWAFNYQSTAPKVVYLDQIKKYYAALKRYQLDVDVVNGESSLAQYSVVIAPSLFVLSPVVASTLTSFVAGGGVLVLTFRSGFKNEDNNVVDAVLPGLTFSGLAGIQIHDWDPDFGQTQTVNFGDKQYNATVFYDVLTPSSSATKVLATYTQQFESGSAAVTVNPYQKGTTIYVGTQSSDDDFYLRIVSVAAQYGNVAIPANPLPPGLEVSTRANLTNSSKLLFVLNYKNAAQVVNVGSGDATDILTGRVEKLSSLSVYSFDVKILQF